MAGPFKMTGFSGFGNSPIKKKDTEKSDVVKPVKASSLTVEEQITQANKQFVVNVSPKTKTTDMFGNQLPGVNNLANKAMHNSYSGGGSYKGHTSFKTLPFSEKTDLRNKAFAYQKKMQELKKTN